MREELIKPDVIIMAFFTLFFVIYEFVFWKSNSKKAEDIVKEQKSILHVINRWLIEDRTARAVLLDNKSKINSAADYLVSCEAHGHLVDANIFSRLLSERINKAYAMMQSTANALPIIGLLGTFLGIIIGTLSSFVLIAGDSVRGANDIVRPLILSAGLAFVSSFVALLLASRISSKIKENKNDTDLLVETAERNLLIHFLPNITSTNADQRFAVSVRKLEKTVSDFASSFGVVTDDFISQFKPLVEQQNKTAQHIDSVANKLDENARVLKDVSDRQLVQVNSISDVSIKLSEASDALQSSVKMASENLKEFIKLGDDMQKEISKMHEPLQSIISAQKDSTDKLKELYNDIATYNQTVKDYLNSLNAKLDMFCDVGEKVSTVRGDFDNFSTKLDNMLKDMAEEAKRLHNDLEESFKLLDKNIKTLFDDVMSNRKDLQLTYYDKDAINMLKDTYTANKSMLETMKGSVEKLEKTTKDMIMLMEGLKGWGILRLKRKKQKKDRDGKLNDNYQPKQLTER